MQAIKSREHNCKEPGGKNRELVLRTCSTACPGTLSLPLTPCGCSPSVYFPPTWNGVFSSISRQLLLSELLLPQRVRGLAIPGRPGPFQHPHISSDAFFQLQLSLLFPSSFPKWNSQETLNGPAHFFPTEGRDTRSCLGPLPSDISQPRTGEEGEPKVLRETRPPRGEAPLPAKSHAVVGRGHEWDSHARPVSTKHFL